MRVRTKKVRTYDAEAGLEKRLDAGRIVEMPDAEAREMIELGIVERYTEHDEADEKATPLNGLRLGGR